MRAAFSLAAAAVLAATSAGAQTTEAWQAPTLTTTRYDEDWSAPAPADGHWTDRFKHFAIGDDAFLTTGIELRTRNEDFSGNLWGSADAPDDGYLWLRALPYADLHVGRARAFVQPIAAYAISVAPAPGPIDRSGIDLLQAFGEIGVGPLTLRAGRQMLSLGTERLVGTRYGPNVPLAFDGVRAIASTGPMKLSLLTMRPVSPGVGDFDDRTSPSKRLWGGYATLPGLDIYYLGYRNRAAAFGGDTGRELRQSLGLRSFGARGGWHWNVEGVYQFGRFAGDRIAAWTLGTEIGHAFETLPHSPDATLRLNIVSGDTRGGDGRLGTFNALFPKGKYFGELSPVGPSNIVSLNPRIGASFGGGVSASLAAMGYWRYARADGIYDIPGNLIRAAGTATARFIGAQAEASAAWQATPELELSASLSAFAPGAFIRQTGPARTITMLGLESNFRF
jgi:hypothetical protein